MRELRWPILTSNSGRACPTRLHSVSPAMLSPMMDLLHLAGMRRISHQLAFFRSVRSFKSFSLFSALSLLFFKSVSGTGCAAVDIADGCLDVEGLTKSGPLGTSLFLCCSLSLSLPCLAYPPATGADRGKKLSSGGKLDAVLTREGSTKRAKTSINKDLEGKRNDICLLALDHFISIEARLLRYLCYTLLYWTFQDRLCRQKTCFMTKK